MYLTVLQMSTLYRAGCFGAQTQLLSDDTERASTSQYSTVVIDMRHVGTQQLQHRRADRQSCEPDCQSPKLLIAAERL